MILPVFVSIACHTLIATLICHVLVTTRSKQEFSDCSSILKYGRWSHEPSTNKAQLSWQTNRRIETYGSQEVSACFRNQNLTCIGDSTARQFFEGIVEILDGANDTFTNKKHQDISVSLHDLHINFAWDPFLNRSLELHGNVMVGAGLWYAKYSNNSIPQYFDSLAAFVRRQQEHETRVFSLPIEMPIFEWLSQDRRAVFRPSVVNLMNEGLRNIERDTKLEVLWAANKMTDGHPTLHLDDGLHLDRHAISAQVQLFLNRICNTMLQSQGLVQWPACYTKSHHSRTQIVLSIILVIVLCLCIFTTTCKYCSSTKAARTKPPKADAMEALMAISSALLYCFLSDRTQSLQKTSKVLDVPSFVAICIILAVVGMCTLKKIEIQNLPNTTSSLYHSFLPREQSDEWKGWMQAIILLYHFFGMSRVLWVYRCIRVLVGAYLFLTGYGHTQYFLTTKNFSVRRVTAVLVRLNLLCISLDHLMSTSWDFYYFPALSSFWFMMIYATLLATSKHTATWALFLRIVIAAATITYVTRSEVWFKRVLSLSHSFGGPHINVREFLFRLRLDLYAPFVGMSTAVIHIKLQNFVPRFCSTTIRNRLLLKAGSLILALSGILTYFLIASKHHTKENYNAIHPAVSPIAILSFLLLRNISTEVRSYYSPVFSWLGRCSLETYVLQYHIWLAADAKGLLHLGILDRIENAKVPVVSFQSWRYWVEKAILTIVFLWFSNETAQATVIVTNILTRKRSRI